MKLFKGLTSLAVAGLVAATITGCGEQPAPQQQAAVVSCYQDGVPAPTWICQPSLEGAIVAVGSAPKTAAGFSMQQTIAMGNGRDELARQIQVQVKNKLENFTRTTGVGANETVDAVVTNVSKQVAKVTLNGSKKVNQWTSPKGTLYVLVAVPEKTVNSAAKQAVKTSFKNDQALWQQFQSKQALDSLEKEFPTE